ncbi:MAG: NusG domain II-containing protein [Pseudomonadota bacterium]
MSGLRPGDILLLLAGLALVAGLLLRAPATADRVVIQQAGQTFLETSLRLDRVIAVPGPLGTTEVEIKSGRVRVKADPSPRQLCVQQGWLKAGEAAVCLPNRVSVQLGRAAYDSLNY